MGAPVDAADAVDAVDAVGAVGAAGAAGALGALASRVDAARDRDLVSMRSSSNVARPVRAMAWASYVGCVIATLGVLSSAALAADTIATVLVAIGAALPVVWAIRPESREISASPKISPAS